VLLAEVLVWAFGSTGVALVRSLQLWYEVARERDRVEVLDVNGLSAQQLAGVGRCVASLMEFSVPVVRHYDGQVLG